MNKSSGQLQIYHLEDFSNPVELNWTETLRGYNSGNRVGDLYSIPDTFEPVRLTFGKNTTIVTSSTGVGGFGSNVGGGAGEAIANPRFYTENNWCMFRVQGGRNTTMAAGHVRGRTVTSFRVGIKFVVPVEARSSRYMIKFKYRPVDPPLVGTYSTPIVVSRMSFGKNDTISPTIPFDFTPYNRESEIQLIFEGSVLKYLQDGKVIHTQNGHDNEVVFGEMWNISGASFRVTVVDNPELNCPFAISELVRVIVPRDSRIENLNDVMMVVSRVDSVNGRADLASFLNRTPFHEGPGIPLSVEPIQIALNNKSPEDEFVYRFLAGEILYSATNDEDEEVILNVNLTDGNVATSSGQIRLEKGETTRERLSIVESMDFKPMLSLSIGDEHG